ncbi:sensor histidine kinase [Actinospica sp.]|uniref:sensor histidine kinase n=1 Tax=Actinospica sp. TaxID=1872142 RepID=UPI002CC95577|nr:sensor domain-containing protein [Actinospica sp.]HWG23815.1 sensor domain-containing protein [Actinospica sp.]
MAANRVTVVARRVLREPFTARAWRTFVYCFCQPFVDLFGLGVVLLLLTGSTGSAGLLAPVLLVPLLAFARGLGNVHRGLARGLLGWDVPEPMRAPRRPGVLGFFMYYYGDGIGWRAVGYVLAKILLSVELVVGVAFRLGLPLTLIALAASGAEIQSWSILIIWTVLFFASPRLTELLLLLDQTLMRRLLGPSEDSLRIRELEQTRSHAINEAAATLRRIERDLHDGAQARLVALGMQLGRAERQLERGNAESGLELVRETRAEAKAIAQDLRDLVRGIHPPALDGGLAPALTTLAAKTPIPTIVRVSLETRLSAAAETILYFTAAELLTNAAKHSGARAIAVTVVSDAHDEDVRLIVTDDGCGGARLDSAGSGLRGLSERVRTMDGRLTVDSPVGGPTTVTVRLPANKPNEGN